MTMFPFQLEPYNLGLSSLEQSISEQNTASYRKSIASASAGPMPVF